MESFHLPNPFSICSYELIAGQSWVMRPCWLVLMEGDGFSQMVFTLVIRFVHCYWLLCNESKWKKYFLDRRKDERVTMPWIPLDNLLDLIPIVCSSLHNCSNQQVHKMPTWQKKTLRIWLGLHNLYMRELRLFVKHTHTHSYQNTNSSSTFCMGAIDAKILCLDNCIV